MTQLDQQGSTIVDADKEWRGVVRAHAVVRASELITSVIQELKRKKKVLKKASKCLPVIVPEQLSQAVMSLGPISKTALSVRLVR